jgi:import inner membrane translocase subunit TIM16
MALGNIVRLVAQLVVPIVATIVRALPTAYAEALHNAKKTGTQEVLRRGAKTMSKSEAMQILNVTEAEVTSTPEAVQKVRRSAQRKRRKKGLR